MRVEERIRGYGSVFGAEAAHLELEHVRRTSHMKPSCSNDAEIQTWHAFHWWIALVSVF